MQKQLLQNECLVSPQWPWFSHIVITAGTAQQRANCTCSSYTQRRGAKATHVKTCPGTMHVGGRNSVACAVRVLSDGRRRRRKGGSVYCSWRHSVLTGNADVLVVGAKASAVGAVATRGADGGCCNGAGRRRACIWPSTNESALHRAANVRTTADGTCASRHCVSLFPVNEGGTGGEGGEFYWVLLQTQCGRKAEPESKPSTGRVPGRRGEAR